MSNAYQQLSEQMKQASAHNLPGDVMMAATDSVMLALDKLNSQRAWSKGALFYEMQAMLMRIRAKDAADD